MLMISRAPAPSTRMCSGFAAERRCAISCFRCRRSQRASFVSTGLDDAAGGPAGGTIPSHNGSGPIHVAFAIAGDELPDWERRLGEHKVAIRAAPIGRAAAQRLFPRPRQPPAGVGNAGGLDDLLAAGPVNAAGSGGIPRMRPSQQGFSCYFSCTRLSAAVRARRLTAMDATAHVSRPKPRPRPQVMKLTDAAAQRIPS